MTEYAAYYSEFDVGDPSSLQPQPVTRRGHKRTDPFARSPLVTMQDAPVGVRVLVHGAQPAWMEPVVNRLWGFSSLQPNWDGYGARSIEPAAVERAFAFLGAVAERLTESPAVFPTVRGGIEFEWHGGQGDLAVTIDRDGNIGLFQENAAPEEQRASLPDAVQTTVAWLAHAR
jgi:hypothetical protein